MPDYPSHSTDDFAAILTRSLKQPIHDIQVLGVRKRRHSRSWILKVRTTKGSSRIIAKAYRGRHGFETQVNLLKQAAAAYEHRQDICIPYLGSCPSKHLLLMPEVQNPSFKTLFSLSRGQSVQDWRKALISASTRLGNWLRDWHSMTISSDGLDAPLENYLSTREDCLTLISREQQRQLHAVVGALGIEATAVSHGDFSPANVLCSPDRITVIDFGISDWDRMSPWWDYITMEIGIARGMRFAVKSPGMWFPSFVRAALMAFQEGYGKTEGTLRARSACLAIRHLALHSTDCAKGHAYQRRARWHKKQFEQALVNAKKQH